jgi:hypothetical protein
MALSWLNLPQALKADFGYGKRTLGTPASLARHRGRSKARPCRTSGVARPERPIFGSELEIITEADQASGTALPRYTPTGRHLFESLPYRFMADILGPQFKRYIPLGGLEHPILIDTEQKRIYGESDFYPVPAGIRSD